MKKMLTFLLSLVLLLSLCPAALADVISLPEDDFALKHQDECEHETRYYYVNGPVGFAVGYTAPAGNAAETFPNGTRFYVTWTWSDGESKWACIEYDPETLEISFGREAETCWINMEELLADYDSESFMADYADKITEESNQVLIPDYKTYMVCWKYPGSDTISYTIGGHADTIDFHTAYTDGQGRKWGYCGYWRGYRNFWVCLDDPFNENLEPDENFVDVLAQLIPAADEATMEAALKEVKAPNYTLVFGTTGVVAIAAALLVYVLKKKKA